MDGDEDRIVDHTPPSRYRIPSCRKRGEDRGGRRGRKGSLGHGLQVVHPVVGMEPVLEDADLAVSSVDGRDDEAGAGIAERHVAHEFVDDLFERVPVVPVADQANALLHEGAANGSDQAFTEGREDDVTIGAVEISDFGCGFARAEAEGDDAAGRGAGDEIEMSDDGSAAAMSGFQRGKESCRNRPRMPPPSIARMRNSRSAGRVGERVCQGSSP